VPRQARRLASDGVSIEALCRLSRRRSTCSRHSDARGTLDTGGTSGRGHAGLQQSVVADELGISRNRLNELILGKRSVTADTAIRLEHRFSMPARFWLHLQADYDLQATGGARRSHRNEAPTEAASLSVGGDGRQPMRLLQPTTIVTGVAA